ncbi:hypothetical protein BvCmsKSP027_04688 [Escherichia coli]|nr:hypothetical protein BvCmsKSP027_04688 [Escherichia coli]
MIKFYIQVVKVRVKSAYYLYASGGGGGLIGMYRNKYNLVKY